MQQSWKKRVQKKGINVQFSELGFKSKLYENIETQYTHRRIKYKQAKYVNKNSKECFMGRLSFIFDVTTLTNQQLQSIQTFKESKRQQWLKIKYIVYHSQDELKCAICLDTQFKAPQMTFCGHVFCWTCIYMHHFKSLKANNCPVCNEIYQIHNVVTCRPTFNRYLQQNQQKKSKIKLSLKLRKQGDKKIFNSQNLIQDINFTRIIKALPEKINRIYEQQKIQLQNYYKTCDDEETKNWMAKILSLSFDKIQKLNQKRQKRRYKIKKNEKKINQIVHICLEDRKNLLNFYQDFSGKFIFLHPLCDKYIKSQNKQLPAQIQQEVLYWQQAEYNVQLSRKYKEINHIAMNEEIDLVIINLDKLISQQRNREFLGQVEQFKVKRRGQIEKQERQAQRLQREYEQEQLYIKKIRKLQESEFFDIKMPTQIDFKEIGDDTFFPSLVKVKSNQQTEVQQPIIIPLKSSSKKQKQKKLFFIKNESDFPQLFLNTYKKQESQNEVVKSQVPEVLLVTKSLEVKPLSKLQQFPDLNIKQEKDNKPDKNFQKKNNKRKKQKFINVTELFFQPKEQEQEEY